MVGQVSVMSALALVMTGTLAITTMSVASSFAADTDSTETSALGVAEADEVTTIIVQLTAGTVGDDRAGAYRDVKQRFARSVSQASPGGTIGDVRDYHHALDVFSITLPRPRSGPSRACRGSRMRSLMGSVSRSSILKCQGTAAWQLSIQRRKLAPTR